MTKWLRQRLEKSVISKPLVFISASHNDYEWRERLKPKMESLGTQIVWWDDSKLVTGSNWREEITSVIEQARVAVVLLSAEYIASETATSEFRLLAERTKAGRITFFPIVLRQCTWTQLPLLSEIFVWAMGKPIAEQNPEAIETELDNIAESISKLAISERDPPPPKFRFSNTLEDVLRRARSLARESGRRVVTSSCTLFAFADRAGSQPDTARFVRDALERTVNTLRRWRGS